MKKRKPLPIYWKLIVDGKTFDVFPVSSGLSRSQFPSHYRRLLGLKGVSLMTSSQSEFEDFTKRPRL